MTSKVLLTILLLAPVISFSQVNSNLTLYDYEESRDQELIFLGIIDNDTFRIIGDRNNLVKLSKNGLITDSTPGSLKIRNIIVDDKPLLIAETQNRDKSKESNIIINLKTGKYRKLNGDITFLGYFKERLIGGILKSSDHYGVGRYIENLSSYDISSLESYSLSKLKNNDEEYRGVINVLSYPQTNNLVFTWSECYLEFYQCDYVTYYSIDIDDNSLEKLNNQRESREFKSFPIIESNANYVVENYRTYIINERNEILTEVLPKASNPIGWNYSNSTQISYNFISVLDSSKYKNGSTLVKVIVPYALKTSLESSFYNVYNNQEVLQKDLLKLDEHDLAIIKNFTFAKHNYAFDSHFYQAYFNLFDFYNNENKRATRTKNMDGLLTSVDLQNLEKINEALKRFE